MRPRKSTWIWLGVLVVAEAAAAILAYSSGNGGCSVLALHALAFNALFILCWRAGVFLFRLIIRRLALRLAFSYFLIGVVPIPLTAAMLLVISYIVAHQVVANRMRRELTMIGMTLSSSSPAPPRVVLTPEGTVESSSVGWLPVGSAPAWFKGLQRDGFVEVGDQLWFAVRDGPKAVRLLDLSDPQAPWVQRLADATGYEVELFVGQSAREKNGFQIRTRDESQPGGLRAGAKNRAAASPLRRPEARPEPERGLWDGEWIHAFYLETLANAEEAKSLSGHNVAIVKATTSPELVADQLFHQGVPGVTTVFWIIVGVIGVLLLVVYLFALTIALALAGSIARNVNRLTRATQAVARGDFSFRIHSKSRDQIGDLARSFDGMAENIQRLLQETARKERLESEIAMARTIQHKLLPPPEATLPGLSVLAHFDPVDEIGGDYYDYLRMPDGRIAVALGDVSGHGLPTGLLVAMAKSALETLIEAGHLGSDLLARLNEVIHRATDPRHFMTMCVLAYDSATRRGSLSNAGQLAPYRVSSGEVEALSLPALPLGLFPGRTYPTRDYAFAAGDLVVFYSDGFIEAVDGADEAFGYDRFEAVLKSHGGKGAHAVRDAILAALAEHTRAHPQDDDRTLLILTLV